MAGQRKSGGKPKSTGSSGASPPPAGAASAPSPQPSAAASVTPTAAQTITDYTPPRLVLRGNVISDAFQVADKNQRERLGLPADPKDPSRMMIELNLYHPKGLGGAETRLRELFTKQFPGQKLEPISNSYFRCVLTLDQARNLARRDAEGTEPRDRAIYRIWPDFRVRRLIDRSGATVKADAARRSYDAGGAGVTWAVIDSGIDPKHPHFKHYDNLGGSVAQLHRDFTLSGVDYVNPTPADIDKMIAGATVDSLGHGTHVAGIIAGALYKGGQLPEGIKNHVVGQRSDDPTGLSATVQRRTVGDPTALSGIAPRTKLISLKVMGGDNDSSSNVIRALRYIRERVNGEGKIQLINGVNLSLGYEFNARWFACGQSPICTEVDRLVRSGVVVVVAAGNTGYGVLRSEEGDTSTGLSLTINDPGNADLAITVGSTHCYMPHTYGVSYFSSKGPTGDGRLKPDLVAPGERITSCAGGPNLQLVKPLIGNEAESVAAYIDDSGTSMAAPHVSGVIAAFLSIRREFIGQPERVKKIFLDTATSLGRERYFEGHGLADLMRAIQSV